ncbi:MAG: DUF885 domain-containing protein [Lachnospiraceae bacterium]|nr:DUF885 domain-containing protein [Lachnospiraceae bacterium]
MAEQKAFDEWLWEQFEDNVTSDSISLHYTLAHPENYDIIMEEPTLGGEPITEDIIAEDIAEINEYLEEMENFDYELLTYDQRFTYDVLYDYTETDLAFYDNIYLYEPFAYTSGLQTNFPITMSEYTFYDREDVDDYLALLAETPEYFNIYLDFERLKSEKGYFMSENCASEVVRQCNEYIAKPEENLLIVTFNDRIHDVEGLTEDDIENYKQLNYDAVMSYVIPTYQNIITTFKTLKNTGTNDLGVCYFEGGAEYYAYLVKSYVGTDMTPEEIIVALEEAINETMTEYSSVAMGNYDAYLTYYDSFGSLYEELDLRETIDFYQDAFKDRFPEIPDINYNVTPVHESLEEIVSPAFYMTPPMDDYENNAIYTNLGDDGTGALWSTLAHEGIPGHMYQFVYFLSNDPEPIRTVLNFNGYQEGWATYVEMMSFDYYDGYEYDCYADFERINNQLNLLVSARIEIGVNYEGWTLQDTQNYLTTSGFDASVAQDIMDYVVAEPANYQMYCIGWLLFEDLKDKAEDALGENFNEKEFHKVILDAGPCQFYLLEEKVDKYINDNK